MAGYVAWGKALYSVTIGGTNVSTAIAPYLIKLTVTDKAGASSDSASIELDDANARFALPAKGTPVSITLGFVGRGTAKVFEGKVDTVKSTGTRGGGMILHIEAKGFDTTGGAKEAKHKHWDKKPLSTVMSEAGQKAGLSSVAVHPALASITREYWAQDGESMLAFGSRIAREVGATFKIIGDKGVMVPRSAGLSASGKPLTTVSVVRGQNLVSWDLEPFKGRAEYKKVVARWYDQKEAKFKTKEIEIEGAASTAKGKAALKFDRADEGEAEHATKAEGKDAERDKGGGTVTIDGDPTVQSEAPVVVSGCRPGIDGTYKADTVTHTLARSSGYTTAIQVVSPDAKVGKDTRGKKTKT